MASRRPGRYLKMFPRLVASFSTSMSPWRAMGTQFVTKTVVLRRTVCVNRSSLLFFLSFFPPGGGLGGDCPVPIIHYQLFTTHCIIATVRNDSKPVRCRRRSEYPPRLTGVWLVAGSVRFVFTNIGKYSPIFANIGQYRVGINKRPFPKRRPRLK